jgi:hypothetical protein
LRNGKVANLMNLLQPSHLIVPYFAGTKKSQEFLEKNSALY